MKIHKYSSYEEYVSCQLAGNKGNLDGQWGKRDEIQFLSNYMMKIFKDIKFGICHGTKQGNEQKWFCEFTNAYVIGTEIGDTAEQYFNTIRWDFHNVKDEWINNIDFIYSNAFDHSYDPGNCLKKWMSCIKQTGCCILEWSIGHTEENSSMIDPFGATLEEYSKLITDAGFKLKETLHYKSPETPHEKTYLVIVHRKKYFLDCGSNLGQGYEHFRQKYGSEYDYKLFEPNKNCYDKLAEKYGSIKNVTIFNSAIYIKDCIKLFKFDTTFSVGGSIIENHNSAYPGEKEQSMVSCFDINRILDDLSGDEIILKLDIESSEYDVIERMTDTGSIFKVKKIYCEFHTQYMNTNDRMIYVPRENMIIQFVRKNNINFEIWH